MLYTIHVQEYFVNLAIFVIFRKKFLHTNIIFLQKGVIVIFFLVLDLLISWWILSRDLSWSFPGFNSVLPKWIRDAPAPILMCHLHKHPNCCSINTVKEARVSPPFLLRNTPYYTISLRWPFIMCQQYLKSFEVIKLCLILYDHCL